ncbi:unnamed protein product [Linum trigynum]|uniref:DUF4005 domain-containing protein n=1 Tax=Linum trigynum TaxID=586398 RepID=A0AAV2FE99_9ROSI
MGKTGKWLKNFLTGKKEKEGDNNNNREKDSGVISSQDSTASVENPAATPISHPPTTPKEKRRWSFRRSSATAMANPVEPPSVPAAPATLPARLGSENEQKKHAMAMVAATAAAADAAVAAAQAAAAVIRLTAERKRAIEEAAAVMIQSVFRSYLATKALRALKGLVKLQALVRGHLVRKQATATLRCMQALVTLQAKALAQRIRTAAAEDGKPPISGQRPYSSSHRKSTQENRYRHINYDSNRGAEENIKIVEMDLGALEGSTKSRNSYSSHTRPQPERTDRRFSIQFTKSDFQVSPTPSALTEMSPRACSSHFDDYSIDTAQSSPQYYSSAVSKPDPSVLPPFLPRPDYPESVSYDHAQFPSYMANTESSMRKVRSQSAPKARPPEQPSTRRREGRNVPRAVRMQRSSSQVGAAGQNYQFPWAMKLDRSSVSVLDNSECGSTTSTVVTNTNYCRSLVGFDIQKHR